WKTAKSRFCKPVCKPDGAGRLETGDTRRAKGHLTPPVHQGQPRDRRLRETTETNVVWLITQRSRVQIPPPLLISAGQDPSPIRRRVFCVPGTVVKGVVGAGL